MGDRITVCMIGRIRAYQDFACAHLNTHTHWQAYSASPPRSYEPRELKRYSADLLVVDADLDDATGFVAAMHDRFPAGSIIVVRTDQYRTHRTSWPQTGRVTLVDSTASGTELMTVLEAVAGDHLSHSETPVTAIMDRTIVHTFVHSPHQASSSLTSRETEILGLVKMGFGNDQIAVRIGVALATVKNHLHSAFGKLNARSRSEAVYLMDSAESTATSR